MPIQVSRAGATAMGNVVIEIDYSFFEVNEKGLKSYMGAGVRVTCGNNVIAFIKNVVFREVKYGETIRLNKV